MRQHDPDAEIEQRLRSAGDEVWQQLFATARSFLAGREHTTWHGGEQTGTTDVDGHQRRVFTMPYAVYSDDVHRIIGLLGDIGAVFPYDWAHWEGIRRYWGPDALRDASVADAARMATAIIRADRFSEGTIAATINDGTFGAVLERLLRWYDTERTGDP